MRRSMFSPAEFHRHLEALARGRQVCRERDEQDPMSPEYVPLLQDAGFVEATTTLRSPGSPLPCRTVVRVTASGLAALRIAERGKEKALDLYEEILFRPDTARG